MRKIYLILIFLLCFNALGYSSIKVFYSEKDNAVYLENKGDEYESVIPYIIFYNMDANEFYSFVLKDKKWKRGIFPIVNRKINVKKFNLFKIAGNLPKCSDNESCFVGIVLVKNINDLKNSIISACPVTYRASFMRIKGQWIFGNEEYENTLLVPEGRSQKKETVLEKPDIYKFADKILIYANFEAQKLIVISLKDPSNPEKIGEEKFKGNPKEVYKIGNVIVVLIEEKSKTKLISYLIENEKLTEIDEISIDGKFIQSRRRDDVIFGITDNLIFAAKVNNDGGLKIVDTEKINEIPRIVAIFDKYLVTVKYNNSYGDKIEAYPIASTDDPVGKPIGIEVNGRVKSDRHIKCLNDKLIVVTKPVWIQRDEGSSLYIFNLKNGEKISELKNLAPGEELYGTVISNDKVYLVTYRRVDPLWVIDIKDLASPEVIGELKVPGWSEKLFFHNNKLLSLGYLNRLVSIGLFDVSDPENPLLISRLTPLKDKVKYSWSSALNDERAFYRDWLKNLFSLPISTYQIKDRDFVEAFSIEENNLHEEALFSVPFTPERTFWIDNESLGVFSSRELLTYSISENKILKRIPVVFAVDKLKLKDNEIVGVSSDRNIYRIYKISIDNFSINEEIPLENSFSSIKFSDSGKKAILYNYNPFSFQIYNLEDDSFSKIYKLNEDSCNPIYPVINENSVGIYFRCCNVKKGFLLYPKWIRKFSCINGIRIFKDGSFGEFINIPGEPVALIDDNGSFIITEEILKSGLRLNLLKIEDDKAVLIDSTSFKCGSPHAIFNSGKLYVSCSKNFNWRILPMDEKNRNFSETILYKIEISPEEGFNTLEEFKFDKNYNLISVSDNGKFVLMKNQIYPIYRIQKTVSIPYFDYGKCYLYDIFEGDKPILIREIEEKFCISDEKNIILDNGTIIKADGLNGLKILK